MSKIKVFILVIVTLALVIAGVAVIKRGGFVLGASGPSHYQKESFIEGLFVGIGRQLNIDRNGNISSTGTFKIGSSGTSMDQVNTGTCYLRPYASTIAATSTVAVDCQATAAWNASGVSALAGIVAGDSCILQLATSTAGTTFAGIRAIGASASTTSGFIEANIANMTGTTYTWPVTGTASGTASYICTRQFWIYSQLQTIGVVRQVRITNRAFSKKYMKKENLVIALLVICAFGILSMPFIVLEGRNKTSEPSASFGLQVCTVTQTVKNIGHQYSTQILGKGARSWAIIQQPQNATNTVALSLDNASSTLARGYKLIPDFSNDVASSTDSLRIGFSTDLPTSSAVEAITSTGSSTILVIECK